MVHVSLINQETDSDVEEIEEQMTFDLNSDRSESGDEEISCDISGAETEPNELDVNLAREAVMNALRLEKENLLQQRAYLEELLWEKIQRAFLEELLKEKIRQRDELLQQLTEMEARRDQLQIQCEQDIELALLESNNESNFDDQEEIES